MGGSVVRPAGNDVEAQVRHALPGVSASLEDDNARGAELGPHRSRYALGECGRRAEREGARAEEIRCVLYRYDKGVSGSERGVG